METGSEENKLLLNAMNLAHANNESEMHAKSHNLILVSSMRMKRRTDLYESLPHVDVGMIE